MTSAPSTSQALGHPYRPCLGWVRGDLAPGDPSPVARAVPRDPWWLQSWRCSVAHKELSVRGGLAPLLSPVLVSVPAAHAAHLSRSVKRAFVCQQKWFSPHAGSFPRSSDHAALFALVLTRARSVFSRAPILPPALPGRERCSLAGRLCPCPRGSGGAVHAFCAAQGRSSRQRGCSGQPRRPLRTVTWWEGQGQCSVSFAIWASWAWGDWQDSPIQHPRVGLWGGG